MSREAIERIRDAVQMVLFWATRKPPIDPDELDQAKRELATAMAIGRRDAPSVVTGEMSAKSRKAIGWIDGQVDLAALRGIAGELYDALAMAGGDKVPAESADDAEKRRGLQLWNDGRTWREVNSQLGRKPNEAKATEMELKRFAEKKSIFIRPGKPGRAKGTQLEQ